MIEIPYNFPTINKKGICRCGKEETMKHIYICEYFNENNETEKPTFEEIFSGNILQQKKINEIFQQNFQQRIQLKKIKPS